MSETTRVTPAPGLVAAGPALLLAAALLPDLRPLVAVLLAAGWVAFRAARQPGAIAWAAVLGRPRAGLAVGPRR